MEFYIKFVHTLPTKVHLVKAMVFPVVMYGCESWTIRKLSIEELMLLNCGVGEDSWESHGLQGDPTSPFWRRSTLGFLWKEWCWSWNSSTLATSCKEWMDGITDLMDVSLRELREMVMDREAWHTAIHGVAKSRTQLSDWTELNVLRGNLLFFLRLQ